MKIIFRKNTETDSYISRDITLFGMDFDIPSFSSLNFVYFRESLYLQRYSDDLIFLMSDPTKPQPAEFRTFI